MYFFGGIIVNISNFAYLNYLHIPTYNVFSEFRVQLKIPENSLCNKSSLQFSHSLTLLS